MAKKNTSRITVRMARNAKLASTDDWGVGDHYLSIAGYHLDGYFRGDKVAEKLDKQLEEIMLDAHDHKILHNRFFNGGRMICAFWGSATAEERMGLVTKLEQAILNSEYCD